jgi:probable phosphoglycerate mutase
MRTRQSVSILCEELGLSYEDVSFDDRLMERAYGRWEGLTIGEIAARYPEDLDMEKADRWHFAIPGGGESFAAVANRLRDWLKDVPGDRPVIAMAHGGSGRVLRGVCTGSEPQRVFAYDDPQSTAVLISNGVSTAVGAEGRYLMEYGCEDAGKRVRI